MPRDVKGISDSADLLRLPSSGAPTANALPPPSLFVCWPVFGTSSRRPLVQRFYVRVGSSASERPDTLLTASFKNKVVEILNSKTREWGLEKGGGGKEEESDVIVCSCSVLKTTSEEISGFLHKHSMPPFNCWCRVRECCTPTKTKKQKATPALTPSIRSRWVSSFPLASQERRSLLLSRLT